MKADFVFVYLNLNTIVQEKKPETCTFHGWYFKNKEHHKYLNVGTRLLFTPILKFLSTHLVATASIYQKILWFDFDVIYVVLWFLLAVHFILDIISIWIDYHIFEHNYVD